MPDESNPLGPAITALKNLVSNFFHPEDPEATDRHAERFIFHITQHCQNTMPQHICHLDPESIHSIAIEYAKITGAPPAATHYSKPKHDPNQKQLPINEA